MASTFKPKLETEPTAQAVAPARSEAVETKPDSAHKKVRMLDKLGLDYEPDPRAVSFDLGLTI